MANDDDLPCHGGGAHHSHRPREDEEALLRAKRGGSILAFRRETEARRTARFLRPFVRSVREAVGVPNSPLLSEFFWDVPKWPCEVSFKVWHGPQKEWDESVDRLAGRYSAVWRRAGICDAIMSSR
ncbi:hypothetical protein CRG98_011897 [Punica granatum]|uniref:Uncharacterized protein n=1 Tax=Punica granatum TaxID=22663 RepID=A0A2I0KGS5_PUNGR|nr:hypothetical protein CRG98_011897 [Punica granatum]